MLGELDGCPILTSETCALDIIGARYVRDIENGEVVVYSEEGAQSLKPFPPMPPRPCIFEYIYFARPDSVVGGRSVYQIRRNMGSELAREAPATADVVVPVPDIGRAGGDRLLPRRPAFPMSSASSATTMSAAPSSSRPSRSASSACASSTMPTARWSPASASC